MAWDLEKANLMIDAQDRLIKILEEGVRKRDGIISIQQDIIKKLNELYQHKNVLQLIPDFLGGGK